MKDPETKHGITIIEGDNMKWPRPRPLTLILEGEHVAAFNVALQVRDEALDMLDYTEMFIGNELGLCLWCSNVALQVRSETKDHDPDCPWLKLMVKAGRRPASDEPQQDRRR